MKINWKVRIKNPVFWFTIIPAIATCIYTVLGCFGIVPTISQNEVVNVLTAVVDGLITFGVLVDPTTKGGSDSERAMSYNEPM
jgi:phi LC3 family holin